jgi:hypothetical protein
LKDKLLPGANTLKRAQERKENLSE